MVGCYFRLNGRVGVFAEQLFHVLRVFWERLGTASSPPWAVWLFRIVHCAPLVMREHTPLKKFESVLI